MISVWHYTHTYLLALKSIKLIFVRHLHKISYMHLFMKHIWQSTKINLIHILIKNNVYQQTMQMASMTP